MIKVLKHRMLLGVAAWVSIFTFCPSQSYPQSLYSEENLLQFYQYDSSAPLEATLDTTGSTNHLLLFRLAFRSIHHERVTALLYLPKAASPSAPVPVVFWLHGFGGDKTIPAEVLPFLDGLGLAIVSLDAQYHGERKQPFKNMYSLDLLEDRYALAQTILDHRRALDFIATIPTLDNQRVGLIGGSMGAVLGALLAGVDERVKVAILIAGGGGWPEMITGSDLTPANPLREYLRGRMAIVHRLLDPVDPIYFIHRMKSPRALQMHHGDADVTVPYATGRALYERAGEPKEFWTYAGKNHYSITEPLTLAQIINRTITWLNQHLFGTATIALDEQDILRFSELFGKK